MPSGCFIRKSATPRQPSLAKTRLVDDVGLAGADRVGGGAGGAVVVAVRVGDLEDGEPLRAEALEVGALVLEPLAKDQLRLLVLDLRPLDLPARVRERERRQVLAGQEGRDVGRREVEAVSVKAHRLGSINRELVFGLRARL